MRWIKSVLSKWEMYGLKTPNISSDIFTTNRNKHKLSIVSLTQNSLKVNESVFKSLCLINTLFNIAGQRIDPHNQDISLPKGIHIEI